MEPANPGFVANVTACEIRASRRRAPLLGRIWLAIQKDLPRAAVMALRCDGSGAVFQGAGRVDNLYARRIPQIDLLDHRISGPRRQRRRCLFSHDDDLGGEEWVVGGVRRGWDAEGNEISPDIALRDVDAAIIGEGAVGLVAVIANPEGSKSKKR